MTGGSMRVWRAAALALALGLVARPLSAQTYQGGMRGVVKDVQGIVPGVEVTLTNEGTNSARSAVTNEVGEYSFTGVLPGLYTVRVALAGFKTEERKGLRIATQQIVTMDFALEVGGLEEQITVRAVAPVVERSTASVSTTLSAAQITAIPLFGRNTFYTAIATPGVVQSGDPQFVRYQDQSGASLLSLGGGPRRGNAYLIEGVSITDMLNRASWVPSTEGVEDMKVQLKTYDAEMGRAAGGVFNVTARSGANQTHGSGLLMNKPGWGTGKLFFAKRAGTPNPPQYYYSWAGSFGGPIVKDKTFFWFSTDDYKQKSTRNNVLTFPTALERSGDFSQSTVTIYDPLTTRSNPSGTGFIRDPFPGNKIPLNRINPIALAMIGQMPLPTSGRSYNGSASLDDGPQDQETLKIDQRWNNRWTTTGMYAHQHTAEPGSAFWGPHGTIPADPSGTVGYRTIHFLSSNQVIVPNNNTALAVRYGYYHFLGDGTNYVAGFDPSTLGFPASYSSVLTPGGFPSTTINGYSSIGHGAHNITLFEGHTANASLTKFKGKQSFKFGADYRRLSGYSQAPNNGSFTFTQGYTQGPNPNTASSTAGDAFASFLLGYPASGDVNVATPGKYYTDYYSAFAQDDWRVTDRLTLNFGLRYEYEPGVSARDNRFTVGFDRDALFPVQVPGMTLKGGLMYAGVDGYPSRQQQPLNNVAPRGGFAYSLSEKMVVRGGYGLYFVPPITDIAEATIGARGYSASTTFLASTDGGLTPVGTLANPFPNGVTEPQGNSLGLATGAGSVIDFVDQNSKPGYVQQYSFDWQRELPGEMAIAVGYMGSRSERLLIGGTVDATVNLNQLDPQYQSLGTALQQTVPNPFFGIAAFGNLSRSATITRGQLLRPFPQFDNILMHRYNGARARYDALITRWTKRMSNGYALDISETWGRLEDNQFGESNTFSNRALGALDNYDIGREYGVSLLDIAHRVNVNATFELPFGKDRKWLHGGVANALAGGWTVTVAGRYQTGFPLNISQSSNNSNLLGSQQRPNLVEGVDPMTSGSQEERAVNGWINPAAFSLAPAFTFGTVPRTNTEWRGPGQRTTDLAISKTERLGTKSLSLRVDVLNLFDDPLFIGPVTTFGTSTFGQITQVGGFARSLQFQVRLGW
ncbi:MAG TPA: TonB-dependent receptor [Vicinamibacterales bacterium]|nr:TonB-dependent receptor [Vicinamibacterales bacterium]